MLGIIRLLVSAAGAGSGTGTTAAASAPTFGKRNKSAIATTSLATGIVTEQISRATRIRMRSVPCAANVCTSINHRMVAAFSLMNLVLHGQSTHARTTAPRHLDARIAVTTQSLSPLSRRSPQQHHNGPRTVGSLSYWPAWCAWKISRCL